MNSTHMPPLLSWNHFYPLQGAESNEQFLLCRPEAIS